jgi:hypothetical protein
VSVPDGLRLLVWQRARGRCEYCLIAEAEFLFPHQIDHIRAAQHGGPTIAQNLALACPDCNRHKGPNLSSVDPDSNEAAWLFNPRLHRWTDHFVLDGPLVKGLTPTGRATVFLLNFNTQGRVRLRQQLQRVGRYPV